MHTVNLRWCGEEVLLQKSEEAHAGVGSGANFEEALIPVLPSSQELQHFYSGGGVQQMWQPFEQHTQGCA